MKKVLMLSNMYPSNEKDTYGIFVRNIYEGLYNLSIKDEVQLKLCAIKGRKKSLLDGIWKYVKYYASAIFFILFCRFDLIYVHSLTYTNIPLCICRLFRNFTLVVNIHGTDIKSNSLFAKFERSLFRLFVYKNNSLFKTSIIVPSLYFVDVVRTVLPFVSMENIYVSPSGGIANSFFNFRQISSKNEYLRIGYCSRIDEGKGWRTLIAAIQLLVGKYDIPVVLYIAGAGTQTQVLKDTISDSNIPAEYLGPIPHNELPNFFEKIDLFVFPTELEESLGLVGLEALAGSVPVIASNFGGQTSYLNHEKNGFLFQLKNIDSLSSYVVRFHNMTIDQINEMKSEAYNSVRQYRHDLVLNNLYAYLKNT